MSKAAKQNFGFCYYEFIEYRKGFGVFHKNYIKYTKIYSFIYALKQINDWVARKYVAPSPQFVKQQVLMRNAFANAVWVETGTYLGKTTKFLSNHSEFVYSIEPEQKLYENALQYFKSNRKVKVINGLSEDVFPTLLPTLSGKINFWLDGHYSGGDTFAGPNDCPLVDELHSISLNIHRYESVAILVDDVRMCGKFHSYGNYPSLDMLVDFARSNNLDWHIEHDIFIAKSEPT